MSRQHIPSGFEILFFKCYNKSFKSLRNDFAVIKFVIADEMQTTAGNTNLSCPV